MLQVEKSARQRFFIILGVLGFLLGGMLVSGIITRYTESTELQSNNVSLEEIRRESAKLRETRVALNTLAQEGRWAEVVAMADKSLAESDRPAVRTYRAEALWRSQNRDESLKEWEKLLQKEDPIQMADLFALRGDTAAFRKHGEELLNRVSLKMATPLEANNMAWGTLILKNGMADYSQAVALAQKAVQEARDDQDRWTYLNTLGVALYRAGEYQKAIDTLMTAEAIFSDPFNWPFLAMAYYQLDKKAEATEWSERFRAKMDSSFATLEVSLNRHELLLFADEMNALMR
jgi:tetratricopeptide (TPR) repeat protein